MRQNKEYKLISNFRLPAWIPALIHTLDLLFISNLGKLFYFLIRVIFCPLLLQWSISQSINAFDEVKFETASVLADLYDQQSLSHLAKPILRKAIELSQHSIYWHCRLIFQLAVSKIT